MKGYNVLHPMGWDAFGLPTENYALKTGIDPAVSTEKNIARIKEQMEAIGFSYDWSRELNTTNPEYYKWTQWIFLLLFKMGLAYEMVSPINWCPSCKTGLANEEVVNGRCERCGSTVTKKNIRQWVLKITAYADRLLDGLGGLDWPEEIKKLQRNWIGKSEGATIQFQIPSANRRTIRQPADQIPVFTTRPDTLWGATFLVLAPEHQLVEKITTPDRRGEVERYVKKTKAKLDVQRKEAGEKTGVFCGVYAINPATGKKIPIWIADYVLPSYGFGAIMAVPAHDQRDFEFARKYGLPIVEVILPQNKKSIRQLADGEPNPKQTYEGEGILVNSGKFNGIKSEEARKKIVSWLNNKNLRHRQLLIER